MANAVAALLLQVGAAFVGATTIAFTLVMFAMQVNVERMPYGLFRRFSGDLPLMGAFGLTFVLSMGVAALSLVGDPSATPWLLFGLFWTTVSILGLFLFAYRRALRLISPAEQLQFVVRAAQRDLQKWDRRAARIARRQAESGGGDGGADPGRVAFFLANRHWTDVPRKSVEHAIAYARRYAEAGDYDVCLVALNGVVAINTSYIAAKGRSFVATSPFFDIPGADDGFLTHSLELLRQLAEGGIRRTDERQITLALETFAVLSGHYAAIDYGTPQVTHAHLALGYLTGAVSDVVPHEMTDVVMSGVRYVGLATLTMIAHDGALDATSGIDALGAIGEAMAVKADSRPAAQVAVGQLADTTRALLLGPAHRARLALQSTIRAVTRIGDAVLAVPNVPLSRVHSATLASYFGLASGHALAGKITEIANGALSEEADPARVAEFVEGFHEWIQVSREPVKALMLTAASLRSPLSSDLFAWIFQVAEVALALAGADKCPSHRRAELERDGIGLGLLLTWLPDNAWTLQHAENFNLTEQIFGLVVTARRRDSATAVNDFARMLLSWTFKAGVATTGWDTLVRGLTGLAVLALRPEGPFDPSGLKLAILDELSKRQPAHGTFDEAAHRLRRGFREGSYSSDRIEQAAEGVPQGKLDALLGEIADLLSPPPSQAPDNVSVETRL